MKKKIAKFLWGLCIFGVILINISFFLSDEYNYIVFWIAIGILCFSIIPYLCIGVCLGEKPSELLLNLLDFF